MTRSGTASPSSPAGWTCVALELSAAALTAYGNALGLRTPADALDGLLEAIAHSPEWARLPATHWVAKLTPTPRIAAFGRFDRADLAYLEAQAGQLDSACRHFLCFDFDQVFSDCQRLAEQLRSHLGVQLARARFVAIPRGGLVVLGLVASALGLRADQLVAASELDGEAPCVVIDDCAISGACFSSFLATLAAPRVIFAHLVSHPDLRTACRQAEPRVAACLAARDLPLVDLGSESQAWHQHWQARDGAGRYWLGSPVPFCFPWNEPERQLWNPIREVTENAWRMAPPRYCSKNGSSPDAGRRPRIHRSSGGAAGPLRPAAEALAVSPDSQTTIVAAGDGCCYELRGVAASLWAGILEHGRLEVAVDQLAADFVVDRQSLADDCDALVDDLLRRALLVEAPVVD